MNPLHLTRRSVLQRGVVLSAAALAPSLACTRPLRPGDEVSVFPTLMHRSPDGSLQMRIEAWVFERERNPMRTRLLARALGLELDELSAADRQRFIQRAALFGADAKVGRDLAVQWKGQKALALPASDEEGRVRASVPYMGSPRVGQWIDWAVVSGTRRFSSRALWIGDRGISVVSDIDDTIKQTQVRQRREMLLNTFAREFTAVPGMAAWYQRLAHTQAGIAFHYLSGSPLQLMPPMGAFLRSNGFPDGSVHLRAFSFDPAALLDGEATSRHKHAEITQWLADHPQRRFVLVGDSGERDPEVYGALAREHPSRIAAVLIRDVTGDRTDGDRYRQAFDGVAAERWRLFTDPATLPRHWD
jgi:Uncharacterized conserved protein (DUF2183)